MVAVPSGAAALVAILCIPTIVVTVVAAAIYSTTRFAIRFVFFCLFFCFALIRVASFRSLRLLICGWNLSRLEREKLQLLLAQSLPKFGENYLMSLHRVRQC